VSENAILRADLKRLIVTRLRLEGVTADRIDDDAELFGGGLGLDSVDALELVVGLEQEYGIAIKSHEIDPSVFTSVRTLAGFIEATRTGSLGGARSSGT
jgi:acyl carrier protein